MAEQNIMFSFAGPWIGETIGCDSPAHVWEIQVRGQWVDILTCWEGEAPRTKMGGRLMEGEAAFVIGKCKAVLVDPHHFVIAGWDTNDMRGGVGPDFDVVFSRPGIAELSAHLAYRRFREELDRSSTALDASTTTSTFFITRWATT